MINLLNQALPVTDIILRRLVAEGLLLDHSGSLGWNAKHEEIEIIVEEVFNAIRTAAAVLDLPDNTAAGVSPMGTARIRYNRWRDEVEVSKNASAFKPIVPPKTDQEVQLEQLIAVLSGNGKLEDFPVEVLERAVEIVGLAAVARAKVEVASTATGPGEDA